MGWMLAQVAQLYTLYIPGISSMSHTCSPGFQNNTSVGQGFCSILWSQSEQETEQEVKKAREAKEAKPQIEVMKWVWFEED